MSTKSLNNYQLFYGDCLAVLPKIEDNSVDLIATDPPYYKVKKDNWDNQWADVESYLAWLDTVLFHFFRILKPTGSLYLFCSVKLCAETQLLVQQRFKVLNHIIWAKSSGQYMACNKESKRVFASQTERIIFAEHYNADGYAKGLVGYEQQKEIAKESTISPLINYFKGAREALKVPAKVINETTGTQMCRHWFGYSQWELPTKVHYKKLQVLFAEYAKKQGKLNPLCRDYRRLEREMRTLKTAFYAARRYFSVSADVQYTDVWNFKVVQPYPGKHSCEKPGDMMDHIIKTSTRPGDVVLDAFFGSGSMGKSALKLGRKIIGIEFERETYLKAKAALTGL